MIQEVREIIAFIKSDDSGPLRDAMILIFGIVSLFILWLKRVLDDDNK